MKKVFLVGSAVTLAIFLGLGSLYAQPRGRGMMGGGSDMGPGMMGHGGMMRQGPGMGSEYGPQNMQQDQEPQKSIEEKDAERILENYLKSTRNPNLKLGKIEDKGTIFEAEILTKDDSLVDRVTVDKNTGWMRSVY